VDTRSRTAPTHGRDGPARIAGWLGLVALLVAVAYASRIGGGKPDPQVLYHWSTAVGGLVQDAIVLTIVLAIARPRWDLLAFRRPRSLGRAVAAIAGALVAIYVFEGIYTVVAHPGNEQGLTPAHWEPRHAAAYVVNSIVICTWVPFVEELTYRGLGYSLLQRFGRWPAILAVGVLFGLSHGLVVSLPIIALFGCVLAWLRAETRSVLPGMVLHGSFNLVALLAAVVTLHG
jgi:membrane protease YdiL (CAAX protease family)